MTTAITVSEPKGLTPQTVGDAHAMADTLAQSSLVPDAFRGKPADVFMAILYGQELGFSPATSLMSITVIKGKPSLSANAMVGIVMGSGKAKYFRCVESSPTKAVYETQRHGSEPVTKEFNTALAAAAGLTGGNWSKYPQQMMEARAKSFLARDVYPDVIHGVMSTEEVQDFDDAPSFTAPAEIVDVPVEPEETAENLIMEMLECATVEALNSMTSRLSKLPEGPGREKARNIYAEQVANIKAAK